jgi:putative ATPase
MKPLADKIRPQTLDEYIGQEHLIGKGKPIRQAIEQEHLLSFVLWGPPGVGKTTLAKIYARAFEADFLKLSAVSAGKADIRKFIEKDAFFDQPKVLFLDEVHRFNKAQQDFLLPYVENGRITFIGATTENPSFSVISALLSRLRVFTLKSLSDEQMGQIIDRTNIEMEQEAKDWLIRMADGDARQALNVIEATQSLYQEVTVDNLKEALQDRHLRYDKKGEEHYNTISAFIKSMRASDADAAIYYLSRMLDSGEDPLFIARRMVIFASEDIGLAQPTALVVANAVFQAVEQIGLPEAEINLAHGVAYLAEASKSRSSYDALRQAQADVKKYGNLPIPLKLRNPVTDLMEKEGYGKGYEMHLDKIESLLPGKIKNKKYLQTRDV